MPRQQRSCSCNPKKESCSAYTLIDPDQITQRLFYFLFFSLVFEPPKRRRETAWPSCLCWVPAPVQQPYCLRSITHSQGYISVCFAFCAPFSLGCKRCRSCGSPVVCRCARESIALWNGVLTIRKCKKYQSLGVLWLAGSPISTPSL